MLTGDAVAAGDLAGLLQFRDVPHIDDCYPIGQHGLVQLLEVDF